MTLDQFTFQFQRLTKAFTVNKPEHKADIYFEELKKIDVTVFSEAVRRAVRECEKLPTIAKLLSLCDAIGPRQSKGSHCGDCDGFGFVSLWNHAWRARCIHGQKLSKSMAFVPETKEDRTKHFLNLGHEYKKTYGREFPYSIDDPVLK